MPFPPVKNRKNSFPFSTHRTNIFDIMRVISELINIDSSGGKSSTTKARRKFLDFHSPGTYVLLCVYTGIPTIQISWVSQIPWGQGFTLFGSLAAHDNEKSLVFAISMHYITTVCYHFPRRRQRIISVLICRGSHRGSFVQDPLRLGGSSCHKDMSPPLYFSQNSHQQTNVRNRSFWYSSPVWFISPRERHIGSISSCSLSQFTEQKSQIWSYPSWQLVREFTAYNIL